MKTRRHHRRGLGLIELTLACVLLAVVSALVAKSAARIHRQRKMLWEHLVARETIANVMERIDCCQTPESLSATATRLSDQPVSGLVAASQRVTIEPEPDSQPPGYRIRVTVQYDPAGSVAHRERSAVTWKFLSPESPSP